MKSRADMHAEIAAKQHAAANPLGVGRNPTQRERALGEADSYRRHIEHGDVVMAEQCQRTIEDLVGRPVPGGGRVVLPADVLAAMGGEVMS